MSLRTRLVLALAAALVVTVAAFGVPLAISLKDRVDAEIASQATSQADLLAAAADGLLGRSQRPALDALVGRAARASRGRVIVVDAHGRLLADSAGPARGADFSGRPELAAALAGRATRRTRFSRRLDAELQATAAPILRANRVLGAVRVTQSVAAAHRAVRRQISEIVIVALIVLAGGLLIGLALAAHITRPLRRLEATARAVADGDLDVRAPLEGSTEQRSLARSFNDMTARLGALLRGQHEFVADASHQLRTPLAGVRLRLEELDAAALPAEQAADVRASIGEVDRLSRTVDELLVLSTGGELDAPGTPVALADAARAAADRWRAHADQAGIALRVAAGDGDARVLCARADLDRALDAVIENALGYAPCASTVTITAHERSLEISDEGAGLADGEAEAVFQRFHRGRAGRAGPYGSGLGLAITRTLLRRWGGDATIANRVGRTGAVVTLSFPERDFAER